LSPSIPRNVVKGQGGGWKRCVSISDGIMHRNLRVILQDTPSLLDPPPLRETPTSVVSLPLPGRTSPTFAGDHPPPPRVLVVGRGRGTRGGDNWVGSNSSSDGSRILVVREAIKFGLRQIRVKLCSSPAGRRYQLEAVPLLCPLRVKGTWTLIRSGREQGGT
jgi:hypothetical protein